jgi:hypothetical protein
MRASGLKPSSVSTEERLKLLKDPVADEIVNLLPTARAMHYSTLATILIPEIKQGLLTAMKRPVPLELILFTNSRKGHRGLSPLSAPVGWFAGLQDLSDLLGTGHTAAFELRDLPTDSTCPALVWLHQKLILIEAGRQSKVFFGSHNLTLASTITLDEMTLEIESEDLFDEMLKSYKDDLRNYGSKIEAKDIRKEWDTTGSFNRWLGSKAGICFKDLRN